MSAGGGPDLRLAPHAVLLRRSPTELQVGVEPSVVVPPAYEPLLRALAADPAILLLDEPTGALDQDATRAVEDLLAETMAAGLGIVLVTHDVAQAGRLGTERRRMSGGRLT